MSAKLEPIVYNEGMLLKRQRGLRQGNAKKLKFQERYCRLTNTSLDYYDPQPKKRNEGPKGQFAVEQIKIAEPMAKDIFGKEYPYAFQIGDNTEIMYFVAHTEEALKDWMSACRLVAQDTGNSLLSHHHHGVFGLVNKGRWSCCANPRRGCQGCSLATGLDSAKAVVEVTTVSLKTTPPAANKRSPRSDRKFTKSVDMYSVPVGDSDDELTTVPPKIRRFTVAEPTMVPLTPKKLKDLRNPTSEKESSMEEDATDEELEMKGEENFIGTSKKRNIYTSKGGLVESNKKERSGMEDSIELINQSRSEEPDNRSDDTSSMEAKKGDSSSSVDEEDLKRLAGNKTRESPSPSIDSGCGISRPNSQTDTVDMRIHRTESIGKKSVQSLVSDQGVVSDDNNKHMSPKVIWEETDGPGRQTGRQTGSRKMSEKSDDAQVESQEKEQCVDKNSASVAAEQDMPKNVKKMSSPTVSVSLPDAVSLRQRPPSSAVNRSTSSVYDSSGSEMSRSITPQHRKHMTNIGSPSGQDRPRSMANVKGTAIALDIQYLPVFSPLHQACQDGNLDALKEVLNCGELLDLDEPSNGPIPYTALFLAYINDHFQTMVTLLEHGANPDTVEPMEKTCLLQWACQKGVLDMADLLIKYKADVNKKDCTRNSPLMMACKNGHLDIVELLLESGAHVDDDNSNQRTALHEATQAEHTDIMELLLKQSEVEPAARDDEDRTAYDIAYLKKNDELMLMLQLALPKDIRPYSFTSSSSEVSSQMITSIVFDNPDTIITGSRDCKVKFLNASDLSETNSLTLTNTVLDISTFSGRYMIAASTSIQLIDRESPERRRTIADDVAEDENLEDPPLHLVRFGPKGQVATASVESNILKLWPSVAQTSSPNMQPENRIQVQENKDTTGYIYSLTVSPHSNSPWIAVGFQPGEMLKPEGYKLVNCYDWNTRQLHHIFDAGAGGLDTGVSAEFSLDGKQLAIGCAEHLCIWETKTGDLLQKHTITNQAAINCLRFSPNGMHIAVGLDSGQIQVFHIVCGLFIFCLPATLCHSPVSAISYSSCGKKFASGYKNGILRLWEAYVGETETTAS